MDEYSGHQFFTCRYALEGGRLMDMRNYQESMAFMPVSCTSGRVSVEDGGERSSRCCNDLLGALDLS